MSGGHGKKMAAIEHLVHAREKQAGLFISGVPVMEKSGLLLGKFPQGTEYTHWQGCSQHCA
jgi:hypothetical protein